MMISIREMTREDWPSVASIFQEGIDMKTSTFHQEVPTYENWDYKYKQNCRLVAVADGKVVGWTAIQPFSSRAVFSGVGEVSIYISEAYRGHGIGGKLLSTLIRETESHGYWTLQSSIFESNIASILLHEKAGFRMVGYRERIGRDSDGQWINVVLMERRSEIVGMMEQSIEQCELSYAM